MQDKSSESIARTRAKTIFYTTYAVIFFVCPLTLLLLFRLLIGASRTNEYNVYITAVGCGVAVVLAEITAKRLSLRAKK